MSETLLIVGASTRAAAFSALRAGLRPCCADLFADLDLQSRCPTARLEGRYPQGFRSFLERDSASPWMYAGGLENWPGWVERRRRRRTLWGNGRRALSLSRDPLHLSTIFHAAGMPLPAHRLADNPPEKGSWLLKPRRSAGGSDIHFWKPEQQGSSNRDLYFQEFIEGKSVSLLYLGDGRTARFLGATRQLVGVSWLHAAPFRYCGSIGPVDPSIIRVPSVEALGHLLASQCFLEGLFGVDGVLRDGVFFPVEINPRYTASVEVLEYATGATLLEDHARVFTHQRLPPSGPFLPGQRSIGKAILFARDDMTFPHDGPWRRELESPKPVREMPAFADIPSAGERIELGKPILTFFASADSPSTCENLLHQMATDLDRWLYRQ
jgi:predicted ATP-grasp superfamily ATP-dependent carboligase